MQFDQLSLLDCAKEIVDNRGRTCPVGDKGIPLIATNCLRRGSLYPSYETNRFVSDETYETWFRAHPMPGDIIFVTKGSPGRSCLAPNPVDFCIAQDMVAIRADEKKVYPKYLFALLRSDIVRHRIEQMQVGTLIPHFKKGDFGKLFLPIPDFNYQKLVGDTYFDFSQRIDNLSRENSSLEDIARALFKSWFVDFDPVRAKLEGREPEGMNANIAALFPSEFVDSELGPIPKGWPIKALRDIAEVIKGKSYSSKDLISGGTTALVTLKSFERGGGFRMDGFKPYVGSFKPSQVVRSGDIVLSYTDVTQAADLIGRPAIVVGVTEYETLVASLDVGIIRPSINGVLKEYIFGLLRSSSFLGHALSHASGTTVLHLAKEAVPSFNFPSPPDDLVSEFALVADAIRQKSQNNSNLSRSLLGLRDMLMPALISGRVNEFVS